MFFLFIPPKKSRFHLCNVRPYMSLLPLKTIEIEKVFIVTGGKSAAHEGIGVGSGGEVSAYPATSVMILTYSANPLCALGNSAPVIGSYCLISFFTFI